MGWGISVLWGCVMSLIVPD